MKLKFVFLTLFAMGVLAGCKRENLEGANVMVFHSTGNAFGDLMYKGFKESVQDLGGRPVFKSPAESTVAAALLRSRRFLRAVFWAGRTDVASSRTAKKAAILNLLRDIK